MNEQQISLKTVYELRVDASGAPIRYRIPSYQRGYRWTPTQVTQLLEDIRDFTLRENPQPEEFYCLQPLVLRANEDGAYEVVDGQQRLTTLLLILRHFNERLAVRFQQTLYTLEYETRSDLLAFLENPSPEKAAADIDFFHIDQAKKVIDDWFSIRENEVEKIKIAFLNNAKVIWFQLASSEKPVAAFTRLNVGKIALTNGELIRALFLKRRDGAAATATQLRIAYEWDLLEKALQNPDFWCFLSNDTDHQGPRIDVLFDVVAKQEAMKPTGDKYATFNHFSSQISAKGVDSEDIWLRVKQTYMMLEEWFVDRYLYHLVGFLIWCGVDVMEIQTFANGQSKTSFRGSLLKKTIDCTFGSDCPADPVDVMHWLEEQLDGLQYPRNVTRIRGILLLFNIATLLENSESNIRFPFESFKKQGWDIEHVRSVSPDRPGAHKRQVEWMQNCLRYLQWASDAPELQAEIEKFLALPAGLAASIRFDVVYEAILNHFHEFE
jgi:hypothetical protein